jgi:hypothetical protein
VIRVVDHAAEGLPPGIVLKTRLGEREINSVWLVSVEETETEKEVQIANDKPRAFEAAGTGKGHRSRREFHACSEPQTR